MPHTTAALVITFNSGARAPLRHLSNLADAPFTLTWPSENAEGIPAHMRGTTAHYPTAEHAYQALLSLDSQTAQAFETQGRVSMRGVFTAFPVCKGRKHVIADLYERKEKYWGAQKGCRGIAAKMVANLPRDVALSALGLRLAPRHAPVADFAAQLALWRPILEAKFAQNPRIASALADTAPALLVEAGRFPQPGQYWSAFVDRSATGGAPRLIGHNTMGRILTRLRDDELGAKAL